MTILFVDDSPEYLIAMTALCTNIHPDKKVVCFVDAFEAMNFISQNHKEIRGVITDYKMNAYGISGTVIVAKCREKEVPVVVCTGYGKDCPLSNTGVSVIEKDSIDVLINTLKEM